MYPLFERVAEPPVRAAEASRSCRLLRGAQGDRRPPPRLPAGRPRSPAQRPAERPARLAAACAEPPPALLAAPRVGFGASGSSAPGKAGESPLHRQRGVRAALRSGGGRGRAGSGGSGRGEETPRPAPPRMLPGEGMLPIPHLRSAGAGRSIPRLWILYAASADRFRGAGG